MKLAIELEFDESWMPNQNEEVNPLDLMKYGITLAEGVKAKIIYSSTQNDKEYDMIEKVVCGYTGIEPEELHRKTRKREVVEARQICHYIAKQKGLGSFSSIGFRFGRKDHATVIYSANLVSELLKTDKQFRENYKTFIDSFFSDGSKKEEMQGNF